MIGVDLHTHTYFCDGADSVEDMVISAIDKGLNTIGILSHSFVEEDSEGSMPPEKEAEFLAQINKCKEKYKNEIEVLAGVERDMFSHTSTDKYDYVIGSCHYFKVGGLLRAIDISEEDFINSVQTLFGGDYEKAYEWYYNELCSLKDRTNATIVGHFDLITKYNDGNKFFDTHSAKYDQAYKKAVDKLIDDGLIFEINTGAMQKGYKSEPYPSKDIIEYIKQKGGKFILSSDAHKKENIAFGFSAMQNLIK